MSRGMQKRISRARAEGERLGRQSVAEENARLQRELSDTRNRIHRIEIGGKVSTEEAKHLQEMKAIETALEQAHKDGNMADISRLTREMNTKEVAWMERKRTLMATPAEQQQQQQKREEGPAPEGKVWISANADWYDKEGFEVETAAAVAIDQKLLRDGSDPNSASHYIRIQKEMAKKFPDLEVLDPEGEPLRKKNSRDERNDDRVDESGKRRTNDDREELPLGDDEDEDEDDDPPRRGRGDDDDDDDADDEDEDEGERADDAKRGKRKPAFMNMEDSGGGGRRSTVQRRGGRVVLSRTDRSDMVKFGLDPDNDKHVEQYARTVAELEQGDE
jgi:hypothetical protein